MLTPAGRINKLFGTDGGLMLTLYAAFPEDFDGAQPLMVLIEGLEVPLWCEHFERRGQAGAVASFADFDTERRALELVGREFRIETEEDKSDEFFLEDLIGFRVTANGQKGTLTDYFDNDANPLFEMEVQGRKVLVPAVEEFIAGIDFKARRIKFVLPEGLLDIQQ